MVIGTGAVWETMGTVTLATLPCLEHCCSHRTRFIRSTHMAARTRDSAPWALTPPHFSSQA